jgi:hypothetical protein
LDLEGGPGHVERMRALCVIRYRNLTRAYSAFSPIRAIMFHAPHMVPQPKTKTKQALPAPSRFISTTTKLYPPPDIVLPPIRGTQFNRSQQIFMADTPRRFEAKEPNTVSQKTITIKRDNCLSPNWVDFWRLVSD